MRQPLMILFFLVSSPLLLVAEYHTTVLPGSLYITVTDSIPDANVKDPVSRNPGRNWLISGVHTAGYGGSLLILHQTWYSQYERGSFHTFNDSREWLQVDKIGHGWTAYNVSLVSAAMWKWAGHSRKKSAWMGAIGSTAYLSVIELMDAYSEKWGWSWADIGANFFGSGLYLAQELGWQEQRIQYKFSFHRHRYPDSQTLLRANELYGSSWAERMLKDYNAQTYWASVNLRSFLPQSNLPRWLNVAVGYGADGLLGGFDNRWEATPGNEINRDDIKRTRQFYLSPDVDLTKLNVKSKFLKTVLGLANIVKVPAPALMIDSRGKARFYAFYF